MTYTTASFATGSEFRADWSESTPRQRRVNGVMMNVPSSRDFKSDIFSTYEEAESVLSEAPNSKRISWSSVMVRLPGNKRFTMAYYAKKSS